MNATILLADAAQEVGGKLYILGAGWTHIGPQPAPMALALLIEVPWTDTNRKHTASLTLNDGDGNPYLVDTPKGKDGLRIEAQFEVGRPPGLKPGTPLVVPLAINLPPLQLKPDTSYVWKLALDGKSEDGWKRGFYTRPAPPPVIGFGPPS